MGNRTSSPKVSSITADTRTGILVPNREEIATNKKKEDEYISAVRKWTLLEDAPENMMERNTRLWLIDKNNDGYPQEVTAYKYDKNRFTYVKGHQDIGLKSSKYRTERGTDVLIKIPPDNASGKRKRKTKKRKTKKRRYKKMKKGKKSTLKKSSFSTFSTFH
jgi:hypothetical protein